MLVPPVVRGKRQVIPLPLVLFDKRGYHAVIVAPSPGGSARSRVIYIYQSNFGKRLIIDSGADVVVVVVVVEASAQKVYPGVILASASTLSGSVVRTLRGEGLPNMFCLVASSLGYLRSPCSIVCGSSLQRGHRGSAEGPKRLAVGSQVRKEDHVRSVASGHAILGPGEPAIHLRCPQIRRWWIYKRPADEGSGGGIGDAPRRVAGG